MRDEAIEKGRSEVTGFYPPILLESQPSGTHIHYDPRSDKFSIHMSPAEGKTLENDDTVDVLMSKLAHELQHFRDHTVDEPMREGETQEQANKRRIRMMNKYYTSPDEDYEKYLNNPQEARAYIRMSLQAAANRGVDPFEWIRQQSKNSKDMTNKTRKTMYKMATEPEKWEGKIGDYKNVPSDEDLKTVNGVLYGRL
jgi:hypothetical protein